MARIEIDDSRWPLVVFTVPEIMTAEDIDFHFEAIERRLFVRGRYASVMDARLTDPSHFTADLRRHAAAKYDQYKERFSVKLISEAYVLESSLQRGVLTAIRWLAPAPWATKNFSSLDEALPWSLVNVGREPTVVGLESPSLPPGR